MGLLKSVNIRLVLTGDRRRGQRRVRGRRKRYIWEEEKKKTRYIWGENEKRYIWGTRRKEKKRKGTFRRKRHI